ncbi:MAG TPA: Rrf2 family transcriptional regulator [Candidatus Magasanikbacteria bacterium]|nr:Rrf2 family transcriptional regulator [Candidatus Magasanikbacteria bacterium]
MFSLKKETDYALQLLKSIPKDKKFCVSLKDVAKETGVSFLFLQKIARKLRLAGLLKAVQGVNGGYSLSRPANQISLKDIIVAIEGGCAVLPCYCEKNKCASAKCVLKSKMKKINEDILKILSKTKLSQF